MIQYNDLLTFITVLLALAGGINLLTTTYERIQSMRKPSIELKKQVEDHEGYLKNDRERLDELEQSLQILQRSMLAIINHDITGNGIVELKAMRDEIQNYLIER